MTITKIISGDQTGVDQAGLRAARRCNIPTGGWVPRDFMTETGPEPDLPRSFNCKPCISRGYRARTILNVRDSDMTILMIGAGRGPQGFSIGPYLTFDVCQSLRRPVTHVHFTSTFHPLAKPESTAAFITANSPSVINIAGNRESSFPGIGAAVEEYLAEVFEILRESVNGH